MRSMKEVIKEAMRADKKTVEDFRAIAAKRADRAEYYHAAMLFQLARAESAAKMMAAIQAAAALDGVELEDGAPAQPPGGKRANGRARWAVQYLRPRRE